MGTGYLYRKFRILRGLTQKALGEKVDLIDVRIRQYESDARSPKEETLQEIADALDVNADYLREPVYPYSFEEIIRLLFKLEDSIPIGIRTVDIADTKVHSVVFLGHNILRIDQALEAWAQMQFKFMDGEITQEEYEGWKANWPESLAADYKFNPQNRKATYYDEYIQNVQRHDDMQALSEIRTEERKRRGISNIPSTIKRRGSRAEK